MKEKAFEKELPNGYRIARCIDVKNASFGLIFSLITLLIFALTIVLCAIPIIFRANEFFDKINKTSMLIIPLIYFVGYVLYIIAHELIHGFAYKKLTGEKLTFGLSWSCAFCGVPHIFTYRRTALIAVMAPLIFFTTIFIPALIITFVMNPVFYIILSLLFASHIGGCSGDIYVTYLFLTKYKDKSVLMNDTGPRMAIFTYNEAWIDEQDKSTVQFIGRLKIENKIKKSFCYNKIPSL